MKKKNVLKTVFTLLLISNNSFGQILTPEIWNPNISGGKKNLVSDFNYSSTQSYFETADNPSKKDSRKSLKKASKLSERTEIHVSMTDGTSIRYVKIYYLENATTGFDNGYDGETFGGIANTFDIFTNLVTDNLGKKYQIQSLPNSNHENMVIPVGIIANSGKEITLTVEAKNLPEGIKVFLQDITTNTMTRLGETNDRFTITLNTSLNGTGRFYLHTKSNGVLSTTDVNFENFANSNATASFANQSFVGNYGITWTYVASRDHNDDSNFSGIDGKALMLNNTAANSSVTSSSIAGGIKNFSVKLFKGFTSVGNRQVELFINNESYGTSIVFDNYLEQTFTVNNINITGNVVIALRNKTSNEIIIDDITWSSFSPATVTWNGSENTDWATAANWDTNVVPTASDNVVIADVTNKPIISSNTNAEINDLTINGTATLTINNGTLRVYGTSSGNITYNRTLDSENWYLVASPVAGETYNNDYVSANNLAINGSNNAIATYLSATDSWSYMQTNDVDTFSAGKGYSIRRKTGAGAGTISFTGSLNTANITPTVVNGGKGFNLLGNPYTTYLKTDSFLSDNTGNLVSQTMWIFNQVSGSYETKVTVDNFAVAPAQGFFVRAGNNSNLHFSKFLYQTNSGNPFQKSAKTEVLLSMTDGTNNRFAKMYYLENATTGYDNGYDGETFGGVQNSVDIFTHLIADSEGKKYQVQSLPNSDFENMVIPVGIISAAGKEIRFTAEAMNLPETLKVFLEDRVANTITRLDEANASYKVTLNEATKGIGRFYLHTKATDVLGTANVSLDKVSVYATEKNTLTVVGLPQGKASLKLYNILGKRVFATSFNSLGVKNLSLPTLTTGIYIIHLETENGILNKKITLE